MRQFFRLLRISFIKAFEHDQFAVAKAAAYSAIFTLFPAALLLASILVASQSADVFIREISYAIGHIMPPGTRAVVLAYFTGAKPRPIGMLITTSVITLFDHRYLARHAIGLVKAVNPGDHYARRGPERDD